MILTAIALVIVGFTEAIGDLRAGAHSGADAILNVLGYVIVAVTVFDVAKSLFEEEVFRESEKRSAAEARRSLTKFLSTIVIALFLEALVVVFKTARTGVGRLIYPTALLIAAVVALVGLGAYQRFSAAVEQKVGDKDADAARHGPGDNVFAYFIAPFGAVVEFSTAVEIVPEDYRVGAPEDWTWPENRIDQWGLSGKDLAAPGVAERTSPRPTPWTISPASPAPTTPRCATGNGTPSSSRRGRTSPRPEAWAPGW